jgi:hypothetical protein
MLKPGRDGVKFKSLRPSSFVLAAPHGGKLRSKHSTHVFVYRRERKKNLHLNPVMVYRPIEMMNNTAWAERPQKSRAG